ncbi:MAG TPA: hypothetical protein VHZ73_00055 [Vicinamibacterales bacterium]|nr:hypothetical protein [Vicinamibacterales bacterium]
MSRKPLRIAGGAATLFLLLHLPYLPKSLEDVDSINFAMGVRDFDVAHHQPHPPGYPVFIAVAKAVHAAGASEVHALGLMSVVAASVALVAFVVLFWTISGGVGGRALAAAALTAAAPLYWLTASRPLTDATGLAAATAAQALIVSATSDRAIIAASFLAAFGAGIRSQVTWLTVPLLVFVLWRRSRESRAPVAPALAAFVVGGCAWGVPLVMLTGGPVGYWRALAGQGNEDLTNITMLWTTHTVHEVGQALYYAFAAPWAMTALAGAVLTLAAIGTGRAAWRRAPGLMTLAVAFGPYLAFDLLFQETFTARYALPLVAPVAYLAACGAEVAGPVAGAVLVAVVAAFGMHIGGVSVAAYASQPAPAFRLIDSMRSEASLRMPPVLAMHRREDFDLRRPFAWSGAPVVAARLPAPPKHEWLELVKYWNSGGRNPVWFVADPLRSDLALIGLRDAPHTFQYTVGYPVLLDGTRPRDMDWYDINPPDWYAGEGWSLTPETAGISREDRRGPGYAPIEAWVRRWPGAVTLFVGGRNLADAGPATHISVALDGKTAADLDAQPGFFLREIDLPAGSLSGPGDYAHLTIAAGSTQLAIEQFDAAPVDRVTFGFGEGWHEREYNPESGKLWRWTSDHGTIRVHTPKQSLAIELGGEVEASSKSRVTIRVGDKIVAARDIGETFFIRQVIPQDMIAAGTNLITITTDETYVPAERRSRTQDRRLLGLKVFTCRLMPAS